MSSPHVDQTPTQISDITDGDPLGIPGGISSVIVGASAASTGSATIESALPPGSLLRIEAGTNSIKFTSTALASIATDKIQLVSASRTLAQGDVLELERVAGDVSGVYTEWWREKRFSTFTT